MAGQPPISRLWVFLLLSLLIGAAVLSVTRIRFSANIYDLLPGDLPEVKGMDALNRHFSQDSVLTLTLEAPSAPEAEAAAASLTETLLARADLVAKVVRELPMEQMAAGSSGLVAWLWLNGEPEALRSLAERLRKGASADTIAESLSALEDGFLNQETVVQSYDPLGLLGLPGALELFGGPASNPMSSPDGTFRVLFVTGADAPFRDYRLASAWVDNLRNEVEAWRAAQPEFESITTGLTGTPAFMATIGTRMERDLSGSLVLTTILIAILFALMHRRLQPLLWLIAMMLLVLCAALNLGTLLVGDLSIMSAGFAAILMGLVVDYGVVLYREATPEGAAPLRRRIGPGILWASATTAVVFLSLNLSSLPGLAQLGNLVALGVAVGAAMMLIVFAPLAARFSTSALAPPRHHLQRDRSTCSLVLAVLVPVMALGSLAIQGVPPLEREFRPFRIAQSPVFQTWRQMESRLAGRENVTPLIITAPSNNTLRKQAAEVRARLDAAKASGLITRYLLPATIIPNLPQQRENLATIQGLLPERDRLLGELEAAGFAEDGARLTRDLFDHWEQYAERLGSQESSPAASRALTPTGPLAEFVLDRFFSSGGTGGERALFATVQPARQQDRTWIDAICDDSAFVASLAALGNALNQRIKADLLRVFLPMIAILTLMLWVVFRSWRDLLLSIFALFYVAAAILLLTHWSPLEWNAFNLCAIPILFGTGLDYGIHMIFALRRNGGNLGQTRETIGKALLFCGGSSAIGFGTLGFASARGLASLGQVCAAGILLNMVVAVWLLPRWWLFLHRPKSISGRGHHSV